MGEDIFFFIVPSLYLNMPIGVHMHTGCIFNCIAAFTIESKDGGANMDGPSDHVPTMTQFII